MKDALSLLTALAVYMFSSGLILSCIPPYKLPAMHHRDRDDYMTASGGYLRADVRKAFRDGLVVVGMPSYLVLAMYGEPDLVIRCPPQNLICDEVRIYKTTETNVVGSAAILHDTVASVNGQLTNPQRF